MPPGPGVRIFDRRVDTPIGIAAGPLPNSRWIEAYARLGYESAMRLAAKEFEQALGDPVSPTWIAEIYVHLGDKDSAMRWLERGYAERDGFVVTLRDPVWDSLRSDARFRDLVRRIGLPSKD